MRGYYTMWNLKDICGRINELDKLGGLRFMTLHVLEHDPKTGSEVMESIQWHREQIRQVLEPHQKYHGKKIESFISFKPSSGSIYPMLKKLVAEGLLIKRDDGKYELTEVGYETTNRILGHHMQHSLTEPIDRSAIAIETALNEIDSYISFLEDIKKEKLAPNEKRIEIFMERLEKIKKSL
jgi:DNA-binding PadR family transcriptional regulator